MNLAHLHLMFTHLPVVGLGFAILMNIYALVNKNLEIRKLSLWFYVFAGILLIPAYMTGDGVEEIMKTYPGITEELVEPHEHMALVFFIGLLIISAASVIGLYYSKVKVTLLHKLNLYILIAALCVSVFAVLTASTGGAIRHTEIEKGKITTEIGK